MSIFLHAADVGQQLFDERLETVPRLPVRAPVGAEVGRERRRLAQPVLPDRQHRVDRIGLLGIGRAVQNLHGRVALGGCDDVALQFGHPLQTFDHG